MHVAFRESAVQRAAAAAVGRPVVSSSDISGSERSLVELVRLCANWTCFHPLSQRILAAVIATIVSIGSSRDGDGNQGRIRPVISELHRGCFPASGR